MSRSMRWVALLLSSLLATTTFAASQTRTSSFAYDATSGLLLEEIIEPDDSNLCLVTVYVYDDFGNKHTATTRNCSGATGEAAAPTGDAVFTSRTSTTTYAATTANPTAGQFATQSTNALGQSESREFDARFGALTKLTGPNALATNWTYDGFGRKTGETRADGTTTTWAFSVCGTCPSNGKYFVTETSTGAPVKKTYYDLLNREIRSEVQGFSGTPVLKDTEYNTLGQVYRVSKPYLSGDTPVWSTFAYDVLGRVTQTDEPSTASGAVRTVTTYAGLVTTVEVSNAGAGTNLPGGVKQTRVTTKNSQGQVIQVTTQ